MSIPPSNMAPAGARPPASSCPDPGEITTLLRAWSAGDGDAGERLFGLIYPQLRRVVSGSLRMRRPQDVVQTTDLLHETYLRLSRQNRATWNDRMHFFAVAATVVRRVLVDHARRARRQRRGGGVPTLNIDDVALAAGAPPTDLLALDRALEELDSIHHTAARVVDLRYFGGLSLEQTAEALGLGRASAVRAWRFARSWLGQRLVAP